MVGASAGALNLSVGRGHVDFYAVVQFEMSRSVKFVQSFLRCCRHEGLVGQREAMEREDGRAQSIDEGIR